MMRVLKFGGSSLATPATVGEVCRIAADARARGDVVLVVSAFGGVTDSLLDLLRGASLRRADESGERLDALVKRHRDAVDALAAEHERERIRERVDGILRDLYELVHGVSMVREVSPRTLDRGLSVGERLSSLIVAAAMRASGLPAEDCDARALIVTGSEHGHARVDEATTRERIRVHFADTRPLQVVTGFIAATREGETTTLGRGGSDYTASILGAALDAEAVELWTDVSGVMSADPRLVRDARPMTRMSYEELMELSHFGAKVVHPPSVHPTRARGIPLVIRNTFRPADEGTIIAPSAPGDDDTAAGPITGVASIRSIALLRLEGDGMIGVPGIAGRLFGALARNDVNVIMISQASSEHSICVAIREDDVVAATRGVEEEFTAERGAGLVDELVVERELAIVAAVGARMRERAGIAGRLFGLLGSHGVNVRAIAQGSSELNISLVVAAADEGRAVRAIHDAFFVGGPGSASVVVAGVGRVGSALLEQIAEKLPAVRIVGVADSRGAHIDRAGLDPRTAVKELKASDSRTALDAMVRLVTDEPGPARILVDCTAGDDVPRWYEPALRAGASVVTANKRKIAASTEEYRALCDARPGNLFLETTVGAALPVIETLRDLVATGDRVHRIEGLLSGTLSFLANHLAQGSSFSDSVREAHARGYTEPDPREDLAGRDAARKILILARISGWTLEPEAVSVESLLTEDGSPHGKTWNELTLDEFWERLPHLDAAIAARRDEASSRGEKLVYLASAVPGRAGVSLQAVPPEHPCHGVDGTDNLIAFTTERYAESPLVVRGPGAGPALTASGVFADLLRAIHMQGAEIHT